MMPILRYSISRSLVVLVAGTSLGFGDSWDESVSGRITSPSGTNVGVGTTIPGARLDIMANTEWNQGWTNNLRLTAPNYPTIRFFATQTNKTSMIANGNDGGLYFGVNGTGDVYGSIWR